MARLRDWYRAIHVLDSAPTFHHRPGRQTTPGDLARDGGGAGGFLLHLHLNGYVGGDGVGRVVLHRLVDSFLPEVSAMKEKTTKPRSLEQNARMWAMLTDLSRQLMWPVDGEKQRLSKEDWKVVISAGLKRQQRVAKGIEGGFVMLGSSTSQMTMAEVAALIELMFAFGAIHGVQWTDPTVPSDETLAEESVRVGRR